MEGVAGLVPLVVVLAADDVQEVALGEGEVAGAGGCVGGVVVVEGFYDLPSRSRSAGRAGAGRRRASGQGSRRAERKESRTNLLGGHNGAGVLWRNGDVVGAGVLFALDAPAELKQGRSQHKRSPNLEHAASLPSSWAADARRRQGGDAAAEAARAARQQQRRR